MPKELIYVAGGPEESDSRIEVGWQKWQGVQLATTRLRPGADRHREYLDETLGGALRRVWDGQFVDMDRWQLNKLIKDLRRARDEAFGRDE